MATWQYELSDGTHGFVEADDLLSADAAARKLADGVVAVWSIPSISEQRKAAYRDESDPLFFKEQAGEVPEGAWAAKRQEIRDRLPYPA